jgi:hypothetical protein
MRKRSFALFQNFMMTQQVVSPHLTKISNRVAEFFAKICSDHIRVQVVIKKKDVRQQQDFMMPSLDQLMGNIESQALSKDFEINLTRLGEKFLTLLSLTAEDKDTFKFINSFIERDKIFFRSYLRSEMYTDGQIQHKFISREQLNSEILELRSKQQRQPTETAKQLSPTLKPDASLKTKDMTYSLVDIF